MTAEEAISYINQYSYSRNKTGLHRSRELLSKLGNPQDKLKFIHVGGTNGKGSACAMLESILRCAGYKTGLFPSPFIEEFTERIQVCGNHIPLTDLARITETVKEIAEGMSERPTHFELVTAVGMQYFMEQKCDIVVLEVGMGGEFDATNVIKPPLVSVLTNIGLDHTEYLGDTPEKIARTKGGIIKSPSPAVLYHNTPGVEKVIEDICLERGCALYNTRDINIQKTGSGLFGQRFIYEGEEYMLPLLGAHQLENVKTVLCTLRALKDEGIDIPQSAVKTGLAKTEWPARFEVLCREPLFILDGGHNPQCAKALTLSVEEYVPGGKAVFLMGMLEDKDYMSVVDIISPYAISFITVTPDNKRALPAESLAKVLREKGFEAEACKSIGEAVDKALSSGYPAAAFGSLYMAGDIRKEFRKRDLII